MKAEEYIEPEDKTAETVLGATYEIVIKVKGKYDVRNVDKVIGALRFGNDVINTLTFNAVKQHWRITDVTAESDIWTNAVPLINNGPSEEWRLRIRAVKLGGTPVFIAVGVILALLILFVGVVGWNAYKLQELGEETFFNPVFIVGAALIVAIIFLKGRK